MKLGVHQPNYIPWCGYFAKIRYCDVFVFLDDAEISTGQSYVYRARVLGESGPIWLSVPTHRSLHQRIADVTIADAKWFRKHLNKLEAFYRRTPHFAEVFELIKPLYESAGSNLADFNIRMIRAISEFVGIETRMERASSLEVVQSRDERHIALARAVGADTYVSGKGGQNYQQASNFEAAEITLEVREYAARAYPQARDGAFEPGLSILDALFNVGRETLSLLSHGVSAGSAQEVPPAGTAARPPADGGAGGTR